MFTIALTPVQRIWVESNLGIAWQEAYRARHRIRISTEELVSAAMFALCRLATRLDAGEAYVRMVCRYEIWQEVKRLTFDDGTGRTHVSLEWDVPSKSEAKDKVVHDEDVAKLYRSIDRLPRQQKAAIVERLAGKTGHSITERTNHFRAVIELKRMMGR